MPIGYNLHHHRYCCQLLRNTKAEAAKLHANISHYLRIINAVFRSRILVICEYSHQCAICRANKTAKSKYIDIGLHEYTNIRITSFT